MALRSPSVFGLRLGVCNVLHVSYDPEHTRKTGDIGVADKCSAAGRKAL